MASKGTALKRLMDSALYGGVTRGIFVLLTDAAEAAVETDGYLDDDASRFSEGKGDILVVVSDLGAAKVGLLYTVTRVAGDIALTPFKGTG